MRFFISAFFKNYNSAQYEWARKSNKGSIICLTPNQAKVFFVYHIQSKEKTFTEEKIFKEKGEWNGRVNRKKKGFLTAVGRAIKKNPKTPKIKNANELKVLEKTLKAAIKQDFSPDRNPLDYVILDVLGNKTNTTSHQNVGSLDTAIEEEWNNMSEKYILKVCKSFRNCVDTIILKNW